MNVVTPHNVRTVSMTVGELEPGTIFRIKHSRKWLERTDEIEWPSLALASGVLYDDEPEYKVVEIADSVTIEREVTSA
jgi:hypothetical protein